MKNRQKKCAVDFLTEKKRGFKGSMKLTQLDNKMSTDFAV